MYILKDKWRKWPGSTSELLEELNKYIDSYSLFISKTYPYILKMNKRTAHESFLKRTKGYKKAKEIRAKIICKLKN